MNGRLIDVRRQRYISGNPTRGGSSIENPNVVAIYVRVESLGTLLSTSRFAGLKVKSVTGRLQATRREARRAIHRIFIFQC